MPYIHGTLRQDADFYIENLVHVIERNCDETRYGMVNYAVTRITLGALKPEDGWSYAALSHAIAVLRDAAHEMERRLMDPHEDAAMQRNRDIPEYRKEHP